MRASYINTYQTKDPRDDDLTSWYVKHMIIPYVDNTKGMEESTLQVYHWKQEVE